MRARAALVALLVGPLTTGGCSFFFVSGAPSEQEVRAAPRYEIPKCTATNNLPALDGVLGMVTLLATLQAVSSYDPAHDDHSWGKDDLKLVGSVGIAVFVVSAIYGLVQVSGCKTYMDSFAPRPPRRARSAPLPQPLIEPSSP